MADVVQDPSPSKFRQQFVLVAIVLVVLGILFVIFANVIAGGVIALIGAVFGLSSQVGNK